MGGRAVQVVVTLLNIRPDDGDVHAKPARDLVNGVEMEYGVICCVKKLQSPWDLPI